MEELTLKEIQSESLKVLLKLKEICDANGLTYYLAYGTLLGAVRHKGFIPWDDDIDVMMPREDYERLVQYCIDHAEEIKPFCLKHYRTCEEYIYPIARLVDTRYSIVYKDARDYGLGLFVDIYPLDALDYADEKYIRRMRNMRRAIANLGMGRFVPSRSVVKTVLKYPYYLYLKTKDLHKLIEKIDKEALKHANSDTETLACCVWEIDHPLRKAHFAETTELPFESDSFKVPKEYDAVLREEFGDYMQLPPESERIAHHFYSAYRKE